MLKVVNAAPGRRGVVTILFSHYMHFLSRYKLKIILQGQVTGLIVYPRNKENYPRRKFDMLSQRAFLGVEFQKWEV